MTQDQELYERNQHHLAVVANLKQAVDDLGHALVDGQQQAALQKLVAIISISDLLSEQILS